MSVGKRKRFRVLMRDSFTCRYCGRRPPEVTLEVDHVVPVSHGGSDEPDNLMTACSECNAGKSDLSPSAECRQLAAEVVAQQASPTSGQLNAAARYVGRRGQWTPADYPKRADDFAATYIRELVFSSAVQSIGAAGCVLLIMVATEEGESGHVRPAAFYNSQLMHRVGIKSFKQFRTLRARLIRDGWLCCVMGRKNCPALYWVQTPSAYED